METNGIKLLRMHQVLDIVAYKISSVYQKIKNDKFPKPRIKKRGFTAWFSSEIDLYLIYFEKTSENPNLKWSEFLKNRSKK